MVNGRPEGEMSRKTDDQGGGRGEEVSPAGYHLHKSGLSCRERIAGSEQGRECHGGVGGAEVRRARAQKMPSRGWERLRRAK